MYSNIEPNVKDTEAIGKRPTVEGFACFLPPDPVSQTHLQPDRNRVRAFWSRMFGHRGNGATMTSSARPSSPTGDPSVETGKSKKFDIQFYHDWCKACGLCMAFCPRQIIRANEHGKPLVTEPDRCIGCRFCETHCPDFAITVSERQPRRRKDDV
jgi:2-oxoglutarate ferredoxin oxidoreductase subunit delta